MIPARYEAAGGIVLREDEVLVLDKFPKGEWVLPKGHVEPGETREETGDLNPRLLASLGTWRAEFQFNGRHILRDETCFGMTLADEAPSHADALYDQSKFEPHWTPLTITRAAARLTFEPARTFTLALRWAADHAQTAPTE